MDIDHKLISLKEDYEVRYWTQALDSTVSELRAAIDAVGREADKVRAYVTSRKRAAGLR